MLILAILGFAAGAVAGSFLGVVAMRWPAGEQVVRGRSRCDVCGGGLGAAELVPIISYLALRGRCRRCGAPISPSLPGMELGAGTIGLAAAVLARSPAEFAWAPFGWLLLLLAVLDRRHFWLPDRLTFALIGGGLVAAPLIGPGLPDALVGAGAGWAGLEAVRLGYRRLRGREGLGGGDPKLFAGIGAWLGWQALPFVLLGAALIGLCLVAVQLLRHRTVSATTELPMGVFLAASAWCWWLWTRLSAAGLYGY